MDKRYIVIAIVIVVLALALLAWPGSVPRTPSPERATPAADEVVEIEQVDELPVATVDLDDDGPEDCDEGSDADCDG